MQDVQGPVEADPEYLLIVEVNNLAAQIDEEIGMVKTMFISTLYFQILYLISNCAVLMNFIISFLYRKYTQVCERQI